MSAITFSAESRPGDTVMVLQLPAVSRGMLALYAGASGDHVPLHIDTDIARKAGMPDVFAHGMLVAAWLGRMLSDAVGVSRVREMSLRFTGITHLYNRITCRATLLELIEVEGERRARLQVLAENQYGQSKVVGEAVVALA
jgi:acyl dehydratase